MQQKLGVTVDGTSDRKNYKIVNNSTIYVTITTEYNNDSICIKKQ